jgi:hypothetical protein
VKLHHRNIKISLATNLFEHILHPPDQKKMHRTEQDILKSPFTRKMLALLPYYILLGSHSLGSLKDD